MPMGLKSLLVVVGGWLKSNIVSNPVPLRDLEKPKEARWNAKVMVAKTNICF